MSARRGLAIGLVRASTLLAPAAQLRDEVDLGGLGIAAARGHPKTMRPVRCSSWPRAAESR